MNLKTTSKLAVAAIAFAGLLFAGKTNAQTASGYDSQGWRFGIGIEPGIPTGSMHNFSNFALGGNARLQYDLKGPVSLMLTAGFNEFFSKNYTVGNTTVSPTNYAVIPVKAGIKVFPTHNFYFSGEAGAGFEANRTTFNNNTPGTKLILSPGIGVTQSHLDLGLRYENYSGGNNSPNFGQVALRVAYGFGK